MDGKDKTNEYRIIEIYERITRLEEKVNMLDCMMRKIDSRLWAVIAGLAISVATQIIINLIR
jgi:hypothetical protein